MIQRLQSVWLLIASVLAFLTLKISFFSGNILVNGVKEFQKFTAMSNVLLVVLTVIVAMGCLVDIFLYKNRKLQINIAIAALIISLLNLVLYYRGSQTFIPTDWSFDLTGTAAIAIPVFLIMAIRGIHKDDKLIKSVDRLR